VVDSEAWWKRKLGGNESFWGDAESTPTDFGLKGARTELENLRMSVTGIRISR